MSLWYCPQCAALRGPVPGNCCVTCLTPMQWATTSAPKSAPAVITEDTPTRLAAEAMAEHWEQGQYGDKGLRLRAEATARILRWLLTEHARLQVENVRLSDGILPLLRVFESAISSRIPHPQEVIDHVARLQAERDELQDIIDAGDDSYLDVLAEERTALLRRTEAAEAARDEAQLAAAQWRDQLAAEKVARDEAQRQTAALRAALDGMSLILAPEPPPTHDLLTLSPVKARRDWWREGYAVGAGAVADELTAELRAVAAGTETP